MTRPMLSAPGWPFGEAPSLVTRSGAALLEVAMVTAAVQPRGILVLPRTRHNATTALAEALAAFVDSDDPAGFLRARRGH